MIRRRLGGAVALGATAAVYAAAFPGLAVWLGPIPAALAAWVVIVAVAVLAWDFVLVILEDVLAWDGVLEAPLPAVLGLVAVTAAQLGLVTGAAIAGWPVSWMWPVVAASAVGTAVAAFWLWGREERAEARFWAGATRPGRGLLPADQRAVLERLAGNADPLRVEKATLDRLAGGEPRDAAGREPELGPEAWTRALATLEEHGWIRQAPRPALTAQGRAALAHDRSLRAALVTDAMDAMLRNI